MGGLSWSASTCVRSPAVVARSQHRAWARDGAWGSGTATSAPPAGSGGAPVPHSHTDTSARADVATTRCRRIHAAWGTSGSRSPVRTGRLLRTFPIPSGTSASPQGSAGNASGGAGAGVAARGAAGTDGRVAGRRPRRRGPARRRDDRKRCHEYTSPDAHRDPSLVRRPTPLLQVVCGEATRAAPVRLRAAGGALDAQVRVPPHHRLVEVLERDALLRPDGALLHLLVDGRLHPAEEVVRLVLHAGEDLVDGVPGDGLLDVEVLRVLVVD